MWARALLRQVAMFGSTHGRECGHPLRENYICRWRPAAAQKLSFSTTSSSPSGDPSEMESIVLNALEEPTPYTLTKEQEIAVTQSDPVKERKLSELMLRLYIKKEHGEVLPQEIRMEDLKVMIDLGQSQLSKKLRYLIKRSSLKKKISEMKEKDERLSELEIIREERAKIASEMEHPWLNYALYNNTLFPRVFKRSIVTFADCWVGTAMHEGQKIVIDCSYDSQMDDMRIKHTAKQILYCHVYNRSVKRPFSLHLCNLETDGRLMYYIRRLHPKFEIDTPVSLHSGSYLDVFERRNLVYLSPHTTATVEYNPNDIYILGALVDKDMGLALSNKKAAKEKIRSASLPLGKYMKWKKGGKSLCIHQCFQTLLDVKITGDWEKALRDNVPQRKVWDDSGNENLSRFSRVY
ncbi:mitochondrial ribonuclease P protein 1 homolog [Frankliniella occidentalis]|uniref:RNA (guanine-9-)-methyltransferase domain-containing protein 1 n=1 Tax=Frankliniella occidentalis TaxID=133901 RepID=A0A6J1T2R8_FRAOC|nr:mitochondrial ribonuclease P protein 1 homolog [Frankliniella occidentalis]